MSDPDWAEVEGTVGKTVYFTVYKKDGVTVEDLSPYDETGIQLKVWENDDALKFETDMSYFTDGTDGRVKAYISPTDIAIGDEGAYFFTIELTKAETNTAVAGGTDTIFPTNLDEANDFWIGYTITFTAGAVNAGEFRTISAYALATGLVTVSLAFTGIPAVDDPFTITPPITVPSVRGTLQITQGAPE